MTVDAARQLALHLRIQLRSQFEVYFNGRELYDVEDTTFTQAGRVGVWTKADSVTHFDDITVTTK